MIALKLNSEFILKEIAGEHILMFLNESLKNRVITLNDSGAFLFNRLAQGQSEDELVAALLDEYDVDEATARADCAHFLEILREAGALE